MQTSITGKKKEKLQMFFLSGHYPFSPDTSLWNICTGVHAYSNVNVDTAKVVGCAILESMEGKSAADFFKLDTHTTVKFDDSQVEIDPQLLFQSEGEIHHLAHTLYLCMHITGGLCVTFSQLIQVSVAL